MNPVIKKIWETAIELGFQFNETDAHTMYQAVKEAQSYDVVQQVEDGEWLYRNCFIQLDEHPYLYGRYRVFQDNIDQTHIGRYGTFARAKKAIESQE